MLSLIKKLLSNQYTSNTPKEKETIDALWRLEKIILDNLDYSLVTQKIVDSILTELGYLRLGYAIVVLALVDHETNELHRTSISQTEEAKKALLYTKVPFKEIKIPLSQTNNVCIRAIVEGRAQLTNNWFDLLSPLYTPEDAALLQKTVGIQSSMVYPVIYNGSAEGVLIFSMIKEPQQVSEEEKDLIRSFTDIVGLAVQNAKLYTSVQAKTEELKAANLKLQELDKLKDQFVSVASHELRTPLTAIKSYLWMALAGKGGELTEKQKYYVQRSSNAAERLISLVNDMLNISRIEAGRVILDVEKVDLPKLFQEVIEEVTPRASELGLQVTYKQPDATATTNPVIPEVVADGNKIREVLLNLIGNSLKFTPSGGHITLSLEIKEGLVVTHVTDDGVGIEQNNIKNLFQKFDLMEDSYQTNKDVSQGTGLGLYICKSIVELHHGTIWAESEGKQKGASFNFSLLPYSDANFEQLKKENVQVENAADIISNPI